MGKLLTLIAAVDGIAPSAVQPPAEYEVRPCQPSDAEVLGRLYFEAHEPGVACETLEEAVADIRASFDGAYGPLWPAASLAVDCGGKLVAAVFTVRRVPWDDTPDCPFIIELFTARAFRRRGLARVLVNRCLVAATHAAEPAVALRVDAANAAARSLYESLGFRVWTTVKG